MRTRIWMTLAIAAAVVAAAPAPAHAVLAAALRYAMEANLAAYNREDVAATMQTIDSRSPDYDSTKKAIEQQFKDQDVTAELVSFDYIGHDDEFGVARAKVKTTAKGSGGDFTNNTVDAIFLFHQENGTWKLWSEQILAVQMP